MVYYEKLENMTEYMNESEPTVETTTIPDTQSTPTPTPTPTSTIPTSNCPNLLVQCGENIFLYNTNEELIEGKNPILFKKLDEYVEYLEKQRKDENKYCPVLYLRQEVDMQGKNVFKVCQNPYDKDYVYTTLMPTQKSIETMETYKWKSIIENMDSDVKATAIPDSSQSPSPSPSQSPPSSDSTQSSEPIKYMDASRENDPYNKGNYAGFDPTDLYQGRYTELDKIHDSTAKEQELSDNPMDHNWGGVLHTENAVKSGKYDDYNIYKPVLYNPKTTFVKEIPSAFPPPKDIIEPEPKSK